MTTFKRPVLEACLPRLTLDAEPVEKIRAPQKQSGGFGCVLLLANDWVRAEPTRRSQDIFARNVMPSSRGKRQPTLDAYARASKLREGYAPAPRPRRHARLDYEQELHPLAQLSEEAIVPVRSTMPRTRSIHLGAARTFALVIGTLVGGVLVGAPGAHAGVVTAAKKTRKTVAKVVIPKPGTLCPTRAATFPGTSLDCVVVPARGLQWQYRGTMLNPFRLGETAEVWSIEGSRFRMTLTDWNPAVTVPPGDYANELTARNSVLSAYRYRVTLLQSGAGARNLAADAATTAQYAMTANSKSPLRGSQPALPACNGSFDSFPPQPDVKVARETLQVGESGVEASCEEAPVGSNVVIENLDKDAANKLTVYTYFTGTPR